MILLSLLTPPVLAVDTSSTGAPRSRVLIHEHGLYVRAHHGGLHVHRS